MPKPSLSAKASIVACEAIASETGLEHRPLAAGRRFAGIYRLSVMLASGRYGMFDDGMGFSLAPWRPVIEQRLGQQLAATVRGGASWEIGQHTGCNLEYEPIIQPRIAPCRKFECWRRCRRYLRVHAA